MPSGLNATLMTQPVCPLRVRASLAGRRVPDLHRPVVARGGEPRAVGAERHARDRAGMPLEGEGLLAGRRVPDLHRPVVARGGEARAVGAERHARDRAGMPLEGEGLRPVAASHTFTVPSQPAEARRVPSGLNATLIDRAGMPLEGVMARGELPLPVVPLETTAVDAPRLILRPLLVEDLPEQRGVVVFPEPLDRIHVDEVQAAVGQLGLRLRLLRLAANASVVFCSSAANASFVFSCSPRRRSAERPAPPRTAPRPPPAAPATPPPPAPTPGDDAPSDPAAPPGPRGTPPPARRPATAPRPRPAPAASRSDLGRDGHRLQADRLQRRGRSSGRPPGAAGISPSLNGPEDSQRGRPPGTAACRSGGSYRVAPRL